MNKKLRWQVLDRDGHTCVYCGRHAERDRVKLEVDHKIPRSRGGQDVLHNLVTACFDCNRGKSDQPMTCPRSYQRLPPVETYLRSVLRENGQSIVTAAQEAQARGHRLSPSVIDGIIFGRLKNPGIHTIRAIAYALRRPTKEVLEVFAETA